MISGIRKLPPISTSSPRDTITGRPWARAAIDTRTAAALLLTAHAASAPVSSHRSPWTWRCREPRSPLAGSSSSTAYPAAPAAASRGASHRGARPRFVWLMIPVALPAGRRLGAARRARSPRASSTSPSTLTGASAPRPSRSAVRARATASRAAATTRPRGYAASAPSASSRWRRDSTEGSCLRGVLPSVIPIPCRLFQEQAEAQPDEDHDRDDPDDAQQIVAQPLAQLLIGLASPRPAWTGARGGRPKPRAAVPADDLSRGIFSAAFWTLHRQPPSFPCGGQVITH